MNEYKNLNCDRFFSGIYDLYDGPHDGEGDGVGAGLVSTFNLTNHHKAKKWKEHVIINSKYKLKYKYGSSLISRLQQ